MLKIAVFVSGGGTNLAALINAQNDGRIKNGKISLVFSNNQNAYALTRAADNNIKTEVLSKSSFESTESYDNALISLMKENDIDCIVLAGFLSILSPNFINNFKNKIINVHPSLIPSFCGKGCYGIKVHEMALSRGVKITGATVHFVNEIPDDGPIILQKSIKIDSSDTPETLQKRVMEEAEWIILPEAVSLFCEGNLKYLEIMYFKYELPLK